jgi:DMSO/TMAO reductase YedYZ molybdopterin-dependent catalytic subunit
VSERDDEKPLVPPALVPPAPVEPPRPREEPPPAHDEPPSRHEPPPRVDEPTAPVEEPPVPPEDKPARAESEAPSAVVEARSSADVDRELARLSRRGFLTLAAGATAGVLGWRWITSRPREDNQPWPFRRVLRANETLWEGLWDPTRLAPTYPRSRAERNPRVNGRLGLDEHADLAAWRLNVEGAAAGPLSLTLADVQALPARELITELRCVEGWTIVVHWTGVRLSDFIERYPPAARDGAAARPQHPERMPPFVALETPGRGYYVGLDLQSALHPQTLLAYAINDAPLSWLHGAPLRLVAPMKYGVKNLKRIGTLRYTFVRPTDYWYERGYDWYLGH